MHKQELTKIILRWYTAATTKVWIGGKFIGHFYHFGNKPLKLLSRAFLQPKFRERLRHAHDDVVHELLRRIDRLEPGDVDVFFVNEQTGEIEEEDDLD